jgi:multicomponent Na+:H+ antiporter subunit D
MVVEASAASHLPIIWLMLEGASIGTFLHTGLKLPWGTWFARKEAACSVTKPPKNMLVAMGLVALSCVTIGMYPKILYDLLPYPVRFEPYTATHVVDMCQLLLFTFAGFWLLKSRLHGERTITVDFDWFYRVAGNRVMWFCRGPLMAFARIVDQCVMNVVGFLVFFGTHPAEALFVKREQVKLLGIRFFKLGDGIERHVPLMVLDQENPGIEKELPRVTLGASIVMILLLFSIYLAIYLAISD